MADVPRRPLDWLWPGRLPAGAFCLFTGDAELGKSLVLCDVAARLSTGTAWPDGSACPRADVLLCSSEDDLAATIGPRLDAAGAQSGAIHSATRTNIAELPLLLKDLPDVRLVIYDPLSAFMGGIWRDDQIRAVMTPTIRLLESRSCSILGILHWNKSLEARGLNRTYGSKAWTNVARCVWESGRLLGENQFLLRCTKLNIGAAKPPGWRYTTEEVRLEAGGAAPRVRWIGQTEDDTYLDIAPGDRPAWTAAIEVLQALLHEGPVLQTTALRTLRLHGISDTTAHRAKKALNIQSLRVGWGAAGMWYWCLPGASEKST